MILDSKLTCNKPNVFFFYSTNCSTKMSRCGIAETTSIVTKSITSRLSFIHIHYSLALSSPTNQPPIIIRLISASRTWMSPQIAQNIYDAIISRYTIILFIAQVDLKFLWNFKTSRKTTRIPQNFRYSWRTWRLARSGSFYSCKI